MPKRRVRGAYALALAASAGLALPAPAATGAPAPPPAPHRGPERAVQPPGAPRPPIALPRAPALPDVPGATPLSSLLTELRSHYRAADEASTRYRAIEKQLTRQRRTTQRLVARLTEARGGLAAARERAGRLVRQQYRLSLGFSPTVRLLLSDNPERALDEEHELGRAAGRTATVAARLASAEIAADFYATRARQALDRQQSLADRRKRQRDVVRGRLAAVEHLLATLDPGQVAALQQLESTGATGTYGAYGGPAGRPAAGPADARPAPRARPH
ncbi:coiled-coil domain-containing protein [Streptomyces sp. NPDC057702]|uniref:coiled-coil domain-containing protein n=1 Tax=unclassified Streptomyces TaxID=2593676 RepID=UPI00369B7FF3